MKRLTFILFLWLLIVQCARQADVKALVSLQELENNINNEVCVEGIIVHICHVNCDKMKLMLPDSSMVVIVPETQIDTFCHHQWEQKQLRITGFLSLSKITKQELDSLYAAQQLLCSIDLKSCSDTAWVNYEWSEGNAEKILAATKIEVDRQMEKTKLDYIPLFTVKASLIEKVEIAK